MQLWEIKKINQCESLFISGDEFNPKVTHRLFIFMSQKNVKKERKASEVKEVVNAYLYSLGQLNAFAVTVILLPGQTGVFSNIQGASKKETQEMISRTLQKGIEAQGKL